MADVTDGVNDTAAAVAGLLPDARVELAETVRESKASRVLRVRTAGENWAGPGTLIVKRFERAADKWARESAALAVVPARAPASAGRVRRCVN